MPSDRKDERQLSLRFSKPMAVCDKLEDKQLSEDVSIVSLEEFRERIEENRLRDSIIARAKPLIDALKE